ncbi:hypothetical protein CSIM01_03612 [Colletotrichum simmondsii]|uniref:DUF7730 domain-containing protein n=1 Tax=Colletotrichum simmondsii TaxID=703756 RepID=A0A135RR91_9PEZI|nr:hypothetical protein CSIM01_03612 [Colletotrichum simmondsii]
MAEWAKQTYNTQYEKWVPWLEDVYLRWFTKDNKASYATKDTLDKSKVTGVEQVDTLQDGVHNLAAGQVGQGGLLQPVGDMVSKEGVNRAERQGKDDEGGYVPTAVPGSGALNQAGSGVAEGSKTVAGKTTEGVKGAGGFVGGLFGGGAGKTKQEQNRDILRDEFRDILARQSSFQANIVPTFGRGVNDVTVGWSMSAGDIDAVCLPARPVGGPGCPSMSVCWYVWKVATNSPLSPKSSHSKFPASAWFLLPSLSLPFVESPPTEMSDQVHQLGRTGARSIASSIALARKLKRRISCVRSDIKARILSSAAAPKLHVFTGSDSSETLVAHDEIYRASVEDLLGDISHHHNDTLHRQSLIDRSSLGLLGRLPKEIREIVYQQLWRMSGLGQHIILTEAGFGHSRCLLERPESGTIVEGDDAWEFNWMGSDSDARGSVSLWYKREMSAWCDHWKCEEARDERQIWRDIARCRTGHGVSFGTSSPYLPMMLTCKTLYAECSSSIYRSTVFTITDINLARNLSGVRWKTSSSHPLRRINFSFRRQADQGSTFEQWVESWSAILRLLDTPQLMTVNLWLDSDIYYERYWLSVTGNVLRRVPEALVHKVAVSLPPDGHGDRIAGTAWLTGLDEVPWAASNTGVRSLRREGGEVVNPDVRRARA